MIKILSATRAAELQRQLKTREKKQKASITLSGELLRVADALTGKSQRSALIEKAVRRYLKQVTRQMRNEHDRRLIDAGAEQTNRESDGLIELQAWPE